MVALPGVSGETAVSDLRFRLLAGPPLRARRRLWFLGGGIAAVGLAVIANQLPNLVEPVYGRGVGPVLALVLSRISGVLPLSLAELVGIGFLLRQILGAVSGLVALARRQRSWLNALAGGGLRLGQDLGLLAFLFYLFWGFNYYRPPLEARLGLEEVGGGDVAELRTLTQDLLLATNAAYLKVHGTADAGHPTRLTSEELSVIERSLDSGWVAVRHNWPVAGAVAWRYGDVKMPLTSRVLDYMGISGIYFPWTGEANVNRGLPGISLPKAMAHEQAHQRGYAPENEANFMAFLVAGYARHPAAQYSALLFGGLQLLATLARADPEAAQELASLMYPGIRRDLEDRREYWARYRGVTSRATTRLNDAYLRAHRVEGGVLSYSRSASLIVAFARSQGGDPIPSGP